MPPPLTLKHNDRICFAGTMKRPEAELLAMSASIGLRVVKTLRAPGTILVSGWYGVGEKPKLLTTAWKNGFRAISEDTFLQVAASRVRMSQARLVNGLRLPTVTHACAL